MEKDVTDITHHIQRIGDAHKRLDAHEGRITEAHTRLTTHEGRLAKIEKDNAVLIERIDYIIEGQKDIKGTISWLNRTIIGAILAAVMAFVIAGGLNVGN